MGRPGRREMIKRSQKKQGLCVVFCKRGRSDRTWMEELQSREGVGRIMSVDDRGGELQDVISGVTLQAHASCEEVVMIDG